MAASTASSASNGSRVPEPCGRGDWSFSRHIDWHGASYLGIDASSLVVKQLSRSYAGRNVTFWAGDITAELPQADMLIVKDVLQHVPNRCVHQFIRNNLQSGRYRLAVITNDQGANGRNNRDVRGGGFRLLDLTRKPFSLRPAEELHLFDESAPAKVVQVWRAPIRREP